MFSIQRAIISMQVKTKLEKKVSMFKAKVTVFLTEISSLWFENNKFVF